MLSDDFRIESAKCQCPRGLKICQHIAAVLFASQYDISDTDTWDPKPTDSAQVVTVSEVFNIKHPTEDLDKSGVAALFESLLKIPPDEIPKGESQDTVLELTDVRDVILSKEFIEAENGVNFLKKKLQLTPNSILNVMTRTIGQSSNPHWHFARKNRITASNFGKVLDSVNRNNFPPSLFSTLYG